MNLVPGITRLTADGAVGTSGRAIRVFSIELISGATASTTSFKNGTSTAGTAYAQVDGLANSSVVVNYAGGKLFPSGCYMDTDANISYCTVVYSEEL